MATMQDVADRAGVSLSTVSYTLTGKRPVSAATRVRIEQAMADQGYRRHPVARAQASRRTHVLAIANPVFGVSLGATLNEIVHGAVDAAREADYDLVLWPVSSDEPELVAELAAQRTADGVLLMEVALDDPRVAAVEQAGVPCALIGRTADPGDRVWVDIDFEQAIEVAVEHLVGLGHRHLGFVNRSQASFDAGYGPVVRAAAAFDAAMTSRGLEPVSTTCDVLPVAGRRATARLLAEHPDLTGFLVMNELALFGVHGALRDAGLRIPDDVSVVGVAITGEISDMYDHPLTYVSTPGPAQGRRAVEGLLELLDGRRHAPGTNLPCALRVRETSGPPPA